MVRLADKAKGDFYNPRLRHNDQSIGTFGRRQATKLRKYFSKRPLDVIYVSEYIRTKHTFRSLEIKCKLIPIVDHRLNEIDIGIAERLTEDEVQVQYPDMWQALVDQDRDFRWPEGETGGRWKLVRFIQAMHL